MKNLVSQYWIQFSANNATHAKWAKISIVASIPLFFIVAAVFLWTQDVNLGPYTVVWQWCILITGLLVLFNIPMQAARLELWQQELLKGQIIVGLKNGQDVILARGEGFAYLLRDLESWVRHNDYLLYAHDGEWHQTIQGLPLTNTDTLLVDINFPDSQEGIAKRVQWAQSLLEDKQIADLGELWTQKNFAIFVERVNKREKPYKSKQILLRELRRFLRGKFQSDFGVVPQITFGT